MTLREVLEIMFMYTYSYFEAAEAENTVSVTQYVFNKQNFTSVPFIHTDIVFCGLIFTDTSPYNVDLTVLTYF